MASAEEWPYVFLNFFSTLSSFFNILDKRLRENVFEKPESEYESELEGTFDADYHAECWNSFCVTQRTVFQLRAHDFLSGVEQSNSPRFRFRC